MSLLGLVPMWYLDGGLNYDGISKYLIYLAPRAGVQLINYLKALDLQTVLTGHIEAIDAFGAFTNCITHKSPAMSAFEQSRH